MQNLDLGPNIHQMLLAKGIETPTHTKNIFATPLDQETKHHKIALAFEEIMETLNLDLRDDSLAETPTRVAKMYCEEIFGGLNYDNFPKITTIENKMKYDEMIAVKCEVKSMCEHHFVPFIGTAYIAYIPGPSILGLSKFNRVTDFFCRRPQVQERLTAQIHSTLAHILETEDVAVVIKATHYCVHLRGVEDSTSHTVTSKLGGRFKSVPEARQEFLALTRA